MASENKLLGVLQLKADGVLATIDQVNAKLKSLGQGVDLDLTKIINAKVNSQLENLKRQIDEVSKAATASTKAQADAIQHAAQLRVDQLKALQELEKHKTHDTEWDRLQAKVTQTSKAYQEFIKDMSSKDLEKALGVDKVIKAQEKLDSLVNTTRDKALQKTQEEVAKVQARGLEMQVESARKAAQEQQEIRRQQLLADVEASKKETEATLKAIDEKHAAYQKEQEMYATGLEQRVEDARKAAQAEQKATDESYKNYIANQKAYHEEAAKAEEAYYNQVRDARLNIINLEKQLANANLGTAQKTTINQQLADAKQVYSEYAEAVRNQVEADASVVRNLGELAVAESRKLDQEAAQMAQKAQQAAMQAEQMANRLTMVIGRFSLQLLREQWRAAIDYATNYYDTLNEIRVVTGMTEAESRKLGASFRQMAQEMSVTSTEIASAAVTFYRQGLNDTQVKSRLEWVTKYAKVASISFESAAELITASANAMSEDIQGDIQRVVDVFLYLGDNAATTGEEVGKAMQKASASATEFGVSFEWLGSWIATVAEQTRQAPETIGNAFNSMMARLHSIRATGYNSEDEVNINQVAKALATVNVALMDQEGNWRDMTDIFNEVAEQWDSMTGKQKSYIATTVAGVRQQNVFFALMNDLSKGIEDGSRAWELYTGALNSAGTATQKYATWQESLAASQANLTNSLEALYAQLEPNLFKGFYATVSGLVDGLTYLGQGAIYAAIAAGVAVLVVAVKSFTAAIQKSGTVMAATTTAFQLHPLFSAATIVVGVLGLASAIGSLMNTLSSATKGYNDYVDALSESEEKLSSIERTKDTFHEVFDKMQSDVAMTNTEVSEYNSVLAEVSKLSPEAKRAVDDLTQGLISQAEAAEIINGALNDYIAAQQQVSRHNAVSAIANWSVPSEWNDLASNETTNDAMRIFGEYGYNGSMESFKNAMIQFVQAMQEAYAQASSFQPLESWIGEYAFELATELQEMAETLGADIAHGQIGDEQYGILADLLYYKIMGYDDDKSSLKNKMEDEAENLISLATAAVKGAVDDGLLGVWSLLVEDAIIGSDGILSMDDFVGVGEKIISLISQTVIGGIESFSTDEIALAIAKSLFGTDFVYQNEDALLDFAEQSGMVDDLANLYSGLIAAGWSKVDIAKTLGTDVGGWGMATARTFSEAGLAPGAYKTLTSEIEVLLLDLLRLGISVEDIDNAFIEANGDQETYVNNLKNLQQGLKQVTDAGEEAADHFKDIASSLAYVDKIDALLKSINEDKTYDADKLLEIAKTNPEVLAAAGSIDTLRVALEKLRETQLTELRRQYTDLVSSITDIDSEDVSTIVDNLMRVQTGAEKAAEAFDFSSAVDSIEDAKDKIASLRTLLDEYNKNGLLSSGHLMDMSKIAPELAIAYTNQSKNGASFESFIKQTISELEEEEKKAWHDIVLHSQQALLTSLNGRKIMARYNVSTPQEALDAIEHSDLDADQKAAAIEDVNNAVAEVVDNMFAWSHATEEEQSAFEKLLASIENLEKAKGALDTILHPDGKSASDLANAWKTLFDIFPNLEQDGTTSVDVVKTEVNALETSVRSAAEGFGTLGAGIIASMNGGIQAVRLLSETMQNSFFATASQDDIASYIEKNFGTGNVDWMGQKRVPASMMQSKGWDIGDSAYANKASVEYLRAVGDKQYEIMATPILPDGTVLTPAALDAYIDEVSEKASAMGITLLEADTIENGGKGLLYYIAEIGDSLEDASEAAISFDEALSAALAAYANKSLSTIAADINADIQAAREALDGYKTVLDGMSEAYKSEFIDDTLVFFASLSDSTQSGFASEYQELAIALGEVNSAIDEYNAIAARAAETDEQAADKERELADAKKKMTDAETRYGKALKNTQKINSAKYFQNTAKAISQLNLGTIKAADAYATFYTEAEKAVTAQSEFLTATDKLADGSELAAEDIKNLADFLGFVAPEALIENWDQVGPLLAAAIDEGTEALNRLQEAAFIKITGTSEADFSAIQNGLISTKNMAEDTVNALLATGQWTVETLRLDTKAWVQDAAGKWHLERLTGYQQILKPTKNNLLGGAKSSYVPGGATSSGGGGSGGSSSKGMTEVERMLDRMVQIQDIQDHTRSLYSAQANLFKETGQLQGVIQYYQKEIGAIERQNETLQANIAEMEPWLERKKAEVAALKVTDAEYEEAASDLKALQERHQQYTLALINNTAEVDKLTDAIKEQRDAIRQMEIDLRNTILDAIKDREALNERMLEGTIKVEEEILGLIKRRYEKERDMILENTEKQISALEKERDLLSEQLELRKQQAEEEDKAARLAELEAKYARISADPTRQKEALSIQKDIQDLRDEMAWDLAEKEVKAQQDSIDQQIDSLEDYSEYIQNYYEYLFEHPKKLIEEMKTIIMGTDEEIIAWLIKNDEEYAEATEATKKQTEDSWCEMLRDMRGELELFWDEVEFIISQGDDYIINFLKENSAEYREAGKLQAEAYVDEWKKQLEDLRKAYEQVSSDVSPYDYTYIAPAEGSNSGGGGSGGGSGANAASSEKTATLPLLSMADITGGSLAAGNGPINQNKEWADLGTHYWNVEDGDLIQKALNNSTTIRTPTMPNIGSTVNNNGSSMNVGDIIVNVDTLDKDADYEEMAQKVLNAVTEKMNRGAVVGGIRHYTK